MPALRTSIQLLACLSLALLAGCGGEPPVTDTAEVVRKEAAKPSSETPQPPEVTPPKETPKP